MSNYKVKIGDRSLDVKMIAQKDSSITFEIDGSETTVEISPDYSPPQRDVTPSSTDSPLQIEDGKVLSPMPGIITSLPLKKGEITKKGETIAIIEAMKMENNIPAPIEGKIVELHVSVGEEIEAGQPLLRIE